MKKLINAMVLVGLLITNHLIADDVIPSVAKEEMSAYKSAFGKAISESKRAEKADPKTAKDNFGSKVSDAARNMKEEILKDNKNFGAWVSQQRSQRPDDAGAAKGSSDSAKSSTSNGRPSSAEKPDKPHPGKSGNSN